MTRWSCWTATTSASDGGKAWDFRMYNTGQACNANKRMIVMADLFDDFVAK